jgi:hypothetical protein
VKKICGSKQMLQGFPGRFLSSRMIGIMVVRTESSHNREQFGEFVIGRIDGQKPPEGGFSSRGELSSWV